MKPKYTIRILQTHLQDNVTMNELRPRRFKNIVGQKDLLRRLLISIASAKKRDQPLNHILLDGAAGVGKTTIALCTAEELNIPILITIASMLDSVEAITEFVLKANGPTVIFIDEIHRLSIVVEEFLYPVLEDSRLEIDCGLIKSHIDLPPITFIGATTRSGDLSTPFRDRFPIREHLDYYTNLDLSKIITCNASTLGLTLDRGVSLYLAKISRGTPRIANARLLWIRDYAIEFEKKTKLDLDFVRRGLDWIKIDKLGLDDRDRKVIRTIQTQYLNKPVGLNSLATTTGIERSTIEDEVEPWLLHCGLLVRTSRGRQLTASGLKYLDSS